MYQYALSLKEQLKTKINNSLTFYSKFHQNPINQMIHTACIPMILWTSMIWLSQVSLPFAAIPFVGNAASALALAYFVGYCAYDLKIGLVSGLIMAGMTAGASAFCSYVPHAAFVALGLHLTAWAAQFVGHGVYEKNQPALLTGLAQAIYTAPLFSLLEVCEFLNITSLKKQLGKKKSQESVFEDSDTHDLKPDAPSFDKRLKPILHQSTKPASNDMDKPNPQLKRRSQPRPS